MMTPTDPLEAAFGPDGELHPAVFAAMERYLLQHPEALTVPGWLPPPHEAVNTDAGPAPAAEEGPGLCLRNLRERLRLLGAPAEALTLRREGDWTVAEAHALADALERIVLERTGTRLATNLEPIPPTATSGAEADLT